MTDFTINVESIGMDERLSDEKLEQAFRDAEEASERRLEEMEGFDEGEEEEHESPPAPLSAIAGNLSALGAAKKRRRGSISISRVGTHPELAALQADVPTPTVGGNASPVPWAPSTPYHIRSGSASSLTSDEEEDSEVAHEAYAAEENHVTQKQTIVGRRNTISKAVGSVFARTLPRMRSLHGLSDIAQDEVVIGVKVQESTTEEKKVSGEQAEGAAAAGPAIQIVNAVSTTRTSTSQVIASQRNSFVGVGGAVSTATAAASSSNTSTSRGKRNSARLPLRSQTSSRSLPESTAESKKHHRDENDGLRREKSRGSLMYYARLLAQKFRRKSVSTSTSSSSSSSSKRAAGKAASSDNLKNVKKEQMAALPEEERVAKSKAPDSALNEENGAPQQQQQQQQRSSLAQPAPATPSPPPSLPVSNPTPKRSTDGSSPASVPLPPSPITSAPPTPLL